VRSERTKKFEIIIILLHSIAWTFSGLYVCDLPIYALMNYHDLGLGIYLEGRAVPVRSAVVQIKPVVFSALMRRNRNA